MIDYWVLGPLGYFEVIGPGFRNQVPTLRD